MTDLLRVAKAIEAYADWCGGVHDDLCPEDDTCACSGRWINDGITAAVDYLRAEHALQSERDRLRAALVGLIGVDGREELEQLETVMRLMPAPSADKATSVDAIHVLIATLDSAREEQPRVTEDGGRGKSTDEKVTVDHSR
jgi:erythromycin esterase-like protein